MADILSLVLQAVQAVAVFTDELETLSLQAWRLAQRMRALDESLKPIRQSHSPYPRESLRQLLDLVNESQSALDEFWKAPKASRIRRMRSYNRKFTDLNTRMMDVIQTLELGMAVRSWERKNELDRVGGMGQIFGALVMMQDAQEKNKQELLRAIHGSQGDRQSGRYSWTEINPSDVQVQLDEPALGSGAFSTVRLARWEGTRVAVKMMNDSSCASSDTIRLLRGEVRVHERLHHECITHLFGACTMKPNLWLVMEHARKGSLDQYLQRGRGALESALQVAFLSDIASGMWFLHRRGILHRDLKSSNVLVFDQDRLKLCDFGLAKVTGGSVASTGVGRSTVAWMAPEVLDNDAATEKSDLYSFGVVSSEVMTCEYPFRDKLPSQIIYALAHGQRPATPDPAPCPRLVDLTKKCWDQDPDRRPGNFGEVVRTLGILQEELGGDLREGPDYHSGERQGSRVREADWFAGRRLSTPARGEAATAPVAASDGHTDEALLEGLRRLGGDEGGLVYDSGEQQQGSDRWRSDRSAGVLFSPSSEDQGMGRVRTRVVATAPRASFEPDTVARDNSFPTGIPGESWGAPVPDSEQQIDERAALESVTWEKERPPGWGLDNPLATWAGVETDGERVVRIVVDSSRLPGLSLTGGFPPGLLYLRSLKHLMLTYAALSGDIPSQLGELKTLETLHLGDNQLSGRIPPELGNLTSMTELRLWRNQLEGKIPSELGRLKSLKVLYLNHNRLSGEVPRQLDGLTKLERLWLNNNRLEGGIPKEFRRLSSLRSLDLEHTRIGATRQHLERLLPNCAIWI